MHSDDKVNASVIPDEIAVRRRLDQAKEEVRLLKRQLRLSQAFRDSKDGAAKPAETHPK